MTAITAKFDGERIILPQNIRAEGVGEVVVTFSDSVTVTEVESPPARSLQEFVESARPSGRTVEEVTRQIREDRDSWPDPRDRASGDAK